MTKLTLMCSMCGEEREYEFSSEKVNGQTRICEMVKEASNEGWVFQQNGKHYDTYCSAKCAE